MLLFQSMKLNLVNNDFLNKDPYNFIYTLVEQVKTPYTLSIITNKAGKYLKHEVIA